MFGFNEEQMAEAYKAASILSGQFYYGVSAAKSNAYDEQLRFDRYFEDLDREIDREIAKKTAAGCCGHCGKKLEERSPEDIREMEAEAKQVFGMNPADCEDSPIVCDDCFEAMGKVFGW